VNQEPLVSIIIDNYNYEKFLAEAIDSALNQTYPKIEVIVVDDGSTDNSRQLIASYGQRIIPVLKDNGGQASAFNAGFDHSHGEVVIFLDADDILLPHTAKSMAEIFQTNPGIARVQYRLEIVDTNGVPTGNVIPPAYVQMSSGDLRQNVLKYNTYSWCPPTSGHAFAASALEQVLPMPESDFRSCPDYYLVRVNALTGPIVSLDEVGAYYRLHGSNRGAGSLLGYGPSVLNLDQLRRQIELTCRTHAHLKEFVASRGFQGYPDEAADLFDVVFLAQRMISLKLDHQQPIKLIPFSRVKAFHRQRVSKRPRHS